MTTAFFKLTNQFAIEETKGLSASEIRILLFIKTMNPFGDRKLVLAIANIAERLEIDKSTVSRALKKLKELGKITVEIIRKVTISSPMPKSKEDADFQQQMPNRNQSCENATDDAKSHSSVPNCNEQTPNPVQDKQSGTSQTLKTWKDFLISLSELEREKFFNFVKEKTKDFERPIVSITDYLRSQSRYLEFYQQFRGVVSAEEISFNISEWKNKPEWPGILASIAQAGPAFVGIGGIDGKYEHIPHKVRRQILDYVKASQA